MLKNKLKILTKLAAVFAIAAVIMPSMAFAHGNDRGRENENRSRFGTWVTNEFGVKVFERNNSVNTNSNSEDDRNSRDDGDKDNGRHLGEKFKDLREHGFINNLFYNGTVTATSSSTITIESKDGSTFVVDSASAKVVQIPRKVVALSSINTGDAVHITGTKEDNGHISAIVIYVMPANLKPAMATGTVTAVDTNGTVTVQTKDDGTTITVNTDNDTQFSDNNSNTNDSELTSADVEVGMKAKLVGFWDSVLNVFNALKVKLS